jgi:mannose-6-phosphate isomerase-like protein (cupin superfamily)
VVTGHDAQGRSVFVADEVLEHGRARALPGWEFLAVWGGDETPVVPNHGVEPEWTAYFPPPGGFRFSFSMVPPEGLEPPADLHPDEGAAEIERLLPGLLAHMEADDPGMHTTDTIDLEVIISGEVILELDDGAERRLRPGDTVIQNGVRHRWRNPGRVPCVMAIFMLGAQRRDGGQRAP